MKAIHNKYGDKDKQINVVIKEQRYDKWKQFTTQSDTSKLCSKLLSKSKDTINESNSQPVFCQSKINKCCYQRAKIR